MTDDHNRSLDDRLTELEATVRRLETKLDHATRTPAAPAVAASPGIPARRARPKRSRLRVPEQLKDVGYWFRILGIGLLLLGTVFIFKYSEDEGRGMMTLRVAIGAVMGLALAAIGYRLRHSERHFSSVLSGGGIGVWYITGFAAFQIFDLIAALPAFAFMTIVTVLAFMLAVRQNVVALSIIGAVGGMGTPWLLYETDRALAGPVAYMCLVLAGAVAVYAKKRWKALLWSSAFVAGGAFIAIGARYYVDEGATGERITLQVGLAFYWLVFAIVAVFRELKLGVRSAPDPEPQQPDAATRPAAAQFARKPFAVYGDIPIFVTAIPVYAAVMTAAIWDPNTDIGGWVGLLAAIAYAFVWRRLEAIPGFLALARAHLLAALVLVTMGVTLLLDGDIMIVTLAAEAAALHLLAKQTPGRLMGIWAHFIYFIIGLVMLGRVLVENRVGSPIINGAALANLWVILSGAGVSWVLRTPTVRFVYRYVAHGLFLMWVMRELYQLPNGQGIVTVVWGLYALTLVVAGLRRGSTKLRVVGLITLFVTVFKLVVVDLSEVKAIWRVLLFSGFGVLLLGLSHWVKRFGKKASE
jgi:uncharacterized membrane protein